MRSLRKILPEIDLDEEKISSEILTKNSRLPVKTLEMH